MGYCTKIIIRHGKLPCYGEVVLHEGEMAYITNKEYFVIGDGKTEINNLKPYTNIVKAEDGRMYAVSVDKDGTPTAELCKLYSEKVNGVFHAE